MATPWAWKGLFGLELITFLVNIPTKGLYKRYNKNVGNLPPAL
jgi:hypothetical protein